MYYAIVLTLTEKRTSQYEREKTINQTRELFCTCESGVAHCQSKQQYHLFRSVLHGQVSLAAVNHIYVFHDAMNGCKKSEDSLKACFENVNIKFELSG